MLTHVEAGKWYVETIMSEWLIRVAETAPIPGKIMRNTIAQLGDSGYRASYLMSTEYIHDAAKIRPATEEEIKAHFPHEFTPNYSIY